MEKRIIDLPNGAYQFYAPEDWMGLIDIENMIDVGCNIGNTIKHYQKACKPKIVYGFEPNIENYNVSEGAIKDLTNVKLFNVAVSNKDYDGQLFCFKDSSGHSMMPHVHGSHETMQNVKVIRLDSWAQQHSVENFDFVKIDTQGNDFNVILGMGDLVDRVKIMKVEVWFQDGHYKGAHLFHEVVEYLLRHGVELYNMPVLTHDGSGQLVWGDAIFMRKDILPRIRK